jgi:hypothetical protein
MRTGRVLIVIGVLFLGLALAIQAQLPLVQRLYTMTFPWGQNYRLLMLTSICAGLLSGLGLVELTRWLRGLRHQGAWRIGVGLAIASAQLTAVLLCLSFSTVSHYYVTLAPDDQMAFYWLHDHLQAGDIVANDEGADAGIWAPYKAGAEILSPHALKVDRPEARAQVSAAIGHLDDEPDAWSTACDLGVRYVYVGAKGTMFKEREFPTAAELRQSNALSEVFSSGDAAVFELRCPG